MEMDFEDRGNRYQWETILDLNPRPEIKSLEQYAIEVGIGKRLAERFMESL